MRAVRTRFAPSPTGPLHTGSARTALFNWLFARHTGGVFILRVEDTDAVRSDAAHEISIYEDLRWLGLDWDEGPDKGGGFGPYRQSERVGIYAGYAERLLAAGAAYRCFCTPDRLEGLKKSQTAAGQPPRYDGRCRDLKESGTAADAPSAVRFRVPGGNVSFVDIVHGPLTYDATDTGDFIILGSDGVASYNFAAALDDSLMGITHVIRGDDHLSNTHRQIMIRDCLGLKGVEYAHIPLVLGPDRTPLSKRHGGSAIAALRDDGYLPEAVVNTAARLGWSPGDEFMTLKELAGKFDISRLSKSPSVFDAARLQAFNKTAYGAAGAVRLAGLLPDELKAADKGRVIRVVDAVKTNASTAGELAALARPFLLGPEYSLEDKRMLAAPGAVKVLKALLEAVDKYNELDGETSGNIMKEIRKTTGEKGRALYMPVRVALTGSHEGIELAGVLTLLGKARVAGRLGECIRGLP